MAMIRVLVGIVIGAAVVIFALQNTEMVSYSFLAWEITAPRVLMFLAVFILGAVTAWLATGISRIKHRKR